MTLPLITLLGFALWTLVLLMGTVGVHRWMSILLRKAPVNSFPADAPTGPAWYQRATRAHANCIENLPIYGAIIVVATFARVQGQLFDVLSVIVLCARVCQSLVHVVFVQTPGAVSVRFTFYSVQLGAVLWMSALVLREIW